MNTPTRARQPAISLRISETDKEHLRALARENERTPSGEIRRAIRYYLANFNAVDNAMARRTDERP